MKTLQKDYSGFTGAYLGLNLASQMQQDDDASYYSPYGSYASPYGTTAAPTQWYPRSEGGGQVMYGNQYGSVNGYQPGTA